MTPDLALACALLVGLLVGILLGSWTSRQRAAAVAAAEERLARERARLDRERRALRDLLVARTPQEAIEMEREHSRAEDGPGRPAPSAPPWTSDARLRGFDPVVRTRDGRKVVQLRSGPPGNQVIHREIPLDELGQPEPTPVVRTPRAPA